MLVLLRCSKILGHEGWAVLKCQRISQTNFVPRGHFVLIELRSFNSHAEISLKAYTLFPGIAMIVVDGFYSIVKLVLIVLKGLMKPNSYSNAGNGEEGVDDVATQQELIRIFTSAKIPVWGYVGGYLVAISFCIGMVTFLFGVAWWQVLMANLLTPIFAVGIIIGIWAVLQRLCVCLLLSFQCEETARG